jgi:cobalamin biosynthesis protein CbiG
MRMPANQLVELLGQLLAITPAISTAAVMLGFRPTTDDAARRSANALMNGDDRQSFTAPARDLLAGLGRRVS